MSYDTNHSEQILKLNSEKKKNVFKNYSNQVPQW